jgi:hypothetical protein
MQLLIVCIAAYCCARHVVLALFAFFVGMLWYQQMLVF